jgi:hypothetical protein
MIDLTIEPEEINALIVKYASLLEYVKPEEQAYHTYVIDYAIKYLNSNFAAINKVWKSWIILVVVKSIRKFNIESDIDAVINDFIIYHNNNYKSYIEDMISDDIDRDCGFIYHYINEKNRKIPIS